MIVATRDRMVRNRVVTLDRAMTQDELIQLRNYVNANFAGWTLEKARAELLRRIEEERAHIRCGAAAADFALPERLAAWPIRIRRSPWTARLIW